MRSSPYVICIGFLVVGSVTLLGCGDAQTSTSDSPAGEHDHESHGSESEHAESESFASALTELDELSSAIKTAFADGDMDKADGPVHAVGHLLGQLPELAAQLSEDERQQVVEAVDSLMENFGALDERLHGGDSAGKSYDEVASDIADSLKVLKSIKQPENQP